MINFQEFKTILRERRTRRKIITVTNEELKLCNHLHEFEKVMAALPEVRNHARLMINRGFKEGRKREVCQEMFEYVTNVKLDFNQIGDSFIKALELHTKEVKPTRIKHSQEVKEKFLKDCNYICPDCGKVISLKNAHFDHIIPFMLVFDELGLENLRVVCPECSRKKHAFILPDLLKVDDDAVKQKGVIHIDVPSKKVKSAMNSLMPDIMKD